MPKWLIVLLAVAAIGVIYTVAQNAGVGQTCAVNAFGTKMCGDDLRAWCDATDPLRAEADQFGAGTSATEEAKRICADVR